MPWNPKLYNQFKDIRFKPFQDLSALIVSEPRMKAVDLGCGTGEQTAILSERFPQATFLGLDASAEMLSNSDQLAHGRLQFSNSSVENFLGTAETWDLIFSNAALQWLDDHRILFPKLISKLTRGGQLAIQMPLQPENVLNKILIEMAAEEPFCSYLKGWNRVSPVLSLDDYAELLYKEGLVQLDLSIRVYPIVADSEKMLYEFIAGSALIPYMEHLEKERHQLFIHAFRSRIRAHFPEFPAIYPFKRLLLYGRRA